MKTPNLPKSVKSLAEMYAIGSISLTQVAEEVEKYPLADQALMMSRAMIYSHLFYLDYEEWWMKQTSKDPDII